MEELLATGTVLDWEGLRCVYHPLEEGAEMVHGLPIRHRLPALLRYQPSLAPSPPGQVYLRYPDGRLEGWQLPEDHPVFARETVPYQEYVGSQDGRLASA